MKTDEGGNSLRDNDITVTRAQADYDTTATCQRNATASVTKSQVWVFHLLELCGDLEAAKEFEKRCPCYSL